MTEEMFETVTDETGAVTVKKKGRRAQTAIRVETEETPTPVTTTTPTPAPEQAEEVAELPPEWSHETFKSLLVTPRTKNSVPTLTCIDKGVYKRYFILDVDGDGYKKAWDYYKRTVPNGTPEEFVIIALRVLDQSMPRMHRAVSYVPLV